MKKRALIDNGLSFQPHTVHVSNKAAQMRQAADIKKHRTILILYYDYVCSTMGVSLRNLKGLYTNNFVR